MTSARETELVVRRVIPVARERVFAAWLDPVSLARWMCPGPVVGADVELDPRVGGKFRIVMHKPGGAVEHTGESTDIDIHAREILRMREITNQLLAKHSGQKLDKVEKDVERDFIMNAQQAKEYGIVDDIIYKTR